MFGRLTYSFTVLMRIILCLPFLGCHIVDNSSVRARTAKDTSQVTTLPSSEESSIEYDITETLLRKTAPSTEFRIGKDDKLEISVYAQKDLVITQRVRPDGRVAFPLVGDIEAS